MTDRTISKTSARRLAISRQRLAGDPAPATAEGILEVVRDLGCLQLDPISTVARSHTLVLWSRLGVYNVGDLEKLIYEDRQLFEYWAHVASIVLTEDYPIHDWLMRNYGTGEGNDWEKRLRDWIEANADLRDFILSEITTKGALLSRELELDDKVSHSWTSSGWTGGRNVSQMLDTLWSQGKIMVADRSGIQKRWDLAERCLPDWTPREQIEADEVTRRAAQKSLRALGVATIQEIKAHYTRSRYPNLAAILKALEAEGRIIPVKIEGMKGAYYVHADDLALLERIEAGEWSPRTTLLSPFDNLICDRKRTEALWDFYFRIEIYVPADKRQFGYYVLPILHDDRLIGRVDPIYARKTKTLTIQHIYAEADAPAEAAPQIRAAIDSLATFLGAEKIEYGEVAKIWKKKIR